MDKYYGSLTISRLNAAIKALTEAREYAADARAPEWILFNLRKMSHGIQNRIDNILTLRELEKD